MHPRQIKIPEYRFTQVLHQLQTSTHYSNYQFKNKDSLIAFYQARQQKPVWTNYSLALDAYTNLKNAPLEGLLASDYLIEKIEPLLNPFIQLQPTEQVLLELILTDNIIEYALHIHEGKTNPNTLYEDWIIPSKPLPLIKQLNHAVNNNALNTTLEQLKPQTLYYQLAKKQLMQYLNRDLSLSNKTIVSSGKKISLSDSSYRILEVRKRLKELNYNVSNLNSKKYDSLLETHIKSLQLSKNLEPDGIIGQQTISILNETPVNRYYSILANLERSRWFNCPKKSENITINIANYQLTYSSLTDTLRHKVIVGRNDRKTPVFQSIINHIVFNPQWFIPPTIKNKDIIPKVRNDLSYLSRKNISVYDTQGNTINPDSVNWSSQTPTSYRYVQSSGTSNALGLVKIIFPNPFSVYLHDTSDRELFQKTFRSKSSGCIRLENPFDLVVVLLKNNSKYNDVPKINRQLKNGKTSSVSLKREVGIYIEYKSLLFNSNNKPQFVYDLYGFDTELAQKLLNQF